MESIRSLTGGLFSVDSAQYQHQINEEPDSYGENPVIATNRKKTDFPFLITFLIGILFLVACLGYCIINGDIERITVGYDKCGNVCGKVNDFEVDGSQCRAENMLDKPFFDVSLRSCVESCKPGKIVIGKRCVSTNEGISFLEDIGRDLQTCAGEITGLSFLALGLSFFILMILRYFTAVFVWGVLCGVVAGFASLAGTLWYLTGDNESLTPPAIFFSICTVILLLVILVLRKRIELVIQLLKEAGKSVMDVPWLLFEPVLTFIALTVATIAWVYFTMWIESSGTPRLDYTGTVVFHKNGLIVFSRWYNLFIMLWMVQFIYGCQSMVLAGTISRWYFTRNKSTLKNPICKSASDMIKYHLGTISFGSLLIALIQALRILMRIMRRSLRYLLYTMCLCCVYVYLERCLANIESFVKYWTRNAYVITSIHGTDFLQSGSRAFKLIFENILKVIAINSVGDFVLATGKVLVVLCTVLVGVFATKDNQHLHNVWAVLLLVGIIAFLIAHCFITVYEMAVDTIFICFCEDCEMNDGLSRPYYMSHTLMEFVEKTKVVLNIKMEENVNNTSPSV